MRIRHRPPIRAMLAGLCAFGIACTTQATTIRTDIVFVVDTSSSMVLHISGLQSAIGAITSQFSGYDVDVEYGFVAFGEGYFETVSDLTDAAGVVAAFDPAVYGIPTAERLLTGSRGEPGLLALAHALNGLEDVTLAGGTTVVPAPGGAISYRADAITNIVYLGDEPPEQSWGGNLTTGGRTGDVTFSEFTIADGGVETILRGSPTFTSMENLFSERRALLNAVVSGLDFTCDFGTAIVIDGTAPRYCSSPAYQLEQLVESTGGHFFGLDLLDEADPDGIDAFVESFAATKFIELAEYCASNPGDLACDASSSVPLAASLPVFGTGVLALLVFARGRRGKQRMGVA